MHRFGSSFVAFFAIILIVGLTGGLLNAEAAKPETSVFLLDRATAFIPLSNGIEVRDGEALEQIVALRDDLLRVRIGRKGVLPEDASWAVLADARQSSVSVTPESSVDHVGFRTRSLLVEIDKKS